MGQTELKVKPGQVGTSNATKPDNLGVLDYAHLRVPLPNNLNSSGIFSKGANRKYPEAYFLMVGAHVMRDVMQAHWLTRVSATLLRRLHQRDRHVQGRIPVRAARGRGCGKGLH